MANETGFYDMHGIPIHVGDLIRVKHYKHIRGRRQMWLYFRVARIGGFLFAQNWNDLRPDGHQCLLRDCGLDDAEVVAETIDASSSSPVVTFNERPRKKL